ncbi:PadR family transcriptional regulator [Microbispora rosea]|uniref:DNA-binding transcriptional regulator, PadR family n=1 Tax=Microbispora rosea TaxID=58117 RepID=A0A1N7AG50_9ACTN|nr:PadR family transcriptional regulator [Microbispora rosea]SIR37951.1 DNA-binding transcriptional regulator, PadR family [Microbispora rosea]
MSSTRVLILGVLLDGPLHGYEVRKKLELWGAQHWANVAFGSIYHALGKMAEEGLLEVVGDGRPSGRGRTVYAITPEGRAEFDRRLREHWSAIMPIVDPFQVALTFMDRLSKADLLAVVRERAERLRAGFASFERARDAKRAADAPRHVDECLALSAAEYRAQLEWLEQAVERVERGDIP